MPECPSCSTTVPGAARFCPSCGFEVGGPSVTPTRTGHPADSGGGAGAAPNGRFLPGATIAGRYRIVGLLGRGGMGDVYRADDLKLGQPVALKFLPAEFERSPQSLERLLAEVRAARRVSHSNVCRVFDIGETGDGGHFLSMEYVDGEDLSTLLRRIGHLPRDKALQIAQQLCAGLAAVHAQGLLHRDLKPANVMIDGRGNARLTDFGLAGDEQAFSGAEIRSGTPGYMAPEQRDGRAVTVRSDIWALGHVLHELFTGRHVSGGADVDSRPSLSFGDEGLEPVVGRVIERCLAVEPTDRPATVAAVAAALPGGDALAAAIEAGETPSPEMVAEAGEAGGVAAWFAAASVSIVVVGLAFLAWTWSDVWLAGQVALPKPPEVLAAEARAVLATLGFDSSPVDRAWGFAYDNDRVAWEREQSAPGRWADFAQRRPSPIVFWYRDSPDYLRADRFQGLNVTVADPPFVMTDMVRMWLDPTGRLESLEIIPPERDASAAVATDPNWTPLFEAAGLDVGGFIPAEPEWNPVFDCDVRRAWTGFVTATDGPADDRLVSVRVEAGGWRGRPVYFRTFWPSTVPARTGEPRGMPGVESLSLIVLLFLLSASAVMARHNVKHGRGDRRGALRFAGAWAVLNMFVWAFGADHVPGIGEAAVFFLGVAWSLLTGAMIWVAYLALEPWARRLWPDVLISWNRLIAGRVRDPLVGRDVLIGAPVGVVMAFLTRAAALAPTWFGAPLPEPLSAPLGSFPEGVLAVLGSVRYAVAFYASIPMIAITSALAALFFVLLLRFALRREVVAYVAALVLFTLFWVAGTPTLSVLTIGIGVLASGLLLVTLVRFGLLALVVAVAFSYVDGATFLGFEATWYTGRVLLLLVSCLALLLWGARVAVRAQPAAT